MAETVGIDSQVPQDAKIRSPGLPNGEVLSSQDEDLIENTRQVTSKSVHHVENELLSHMTNEKSVTTNNIMSVSMNASVNSNDSNMMNPGGDASSLMTQSCYGRLSTENADEFHTLPRTSGASTPERVNESYKKRNSREKSDNHSVETKSSSHSGSDNVKGSEDSHASSPASVLAGNFTNLVRQKDPNRREKEKDREERVRLHRERLAEERQRKLEELKEQQRIAQELREYQLEMRRNKIQELRKREEERRAAVEDRRRKKEESERARLEALMSKSADRVARYEQWKSSGKKGLMPGAKPPSKLLSMSMGVLYHKPDFASSGTINHLSPVARLPAAAESMLALHTIAEKGRSFPANSTSTPPHRHKSTVNLSSTTGSVQRRETPRTRRPRPASVAGAMPSFIQTESTPRPSPRSKSTDRLSRIDKPRVPRVPRRMEDKNAIKEEKPIVKKDEESDGEKKRVNRRTIDRLSTPKQVRDKSEPRQGSAPLAAKEKAKLRRSVTNPPSLSKKPEVKEKTPRDKHVTKETPPKDTKQRETPPKEIKTSKKIVKEKVQKPSSKESSPEDKSDPTKVRPSDIMTKSFESPKPEIKEETQKKTKKDLLKTSDEIPAIMTASAPALVFSPAKQTDELSEKELYQAKLAEKRRQAREKAEREAELKRLQEEEERRREEEKLRQEEEEQRRMEEESLRLAEEARKLEEERLQKAIEIEEQRRKEEAEKLEQERIAKEEADRKAKEEQERLDREKKEKKKKEEVERLERKKRLEMIMKRVKPGTESTPESTKPDSPPKSATSSPSKSGQSSSVESGSEDKDENSDDAEDKKSLDINNDTPKFRSPLLQRLVENKSDISNGDTPKFKSPLLQNLLGKTKVGARLGIENRSDGGESESKESSVGSKSESDSCDEQSDRESESPVKMKDIDTSDLESSTIMTDSKTSDTLTNGSVGSVIKNELQDSLYSQEPLNTELVDSSISMQTVSSVTTSQCDSVNTSQYYETVIGEKSNELVSKETPKIDNDFEELIDLSLRNKNLDGKTTSDDLLNYNKVDNEVDGGEAKRTPIIAFEETNRQKDVSAVSGKELRRAKHQISFREDNCDGTEAYIVKPSLTVSPIDNNKERIPNGSHVCCVSSVDSNPIHSNEQNGIVVNCGLTESLNKQELIRNLNFTPSSTYASTDSPEQKSPLSHCQCKENCMSTKGDNCNTNCVHQSNNNNCVSEESFSKLTHSKIDLVNSHSEKDTQRACNSINSTTESIDKCLNMSRFKFLTNASHSTSIPSSLDLEDNAELESYVHTQWLDIEQKMLKGHNRMCTLLEDYGIGEGEEESDSEEGQIWRMVQGEAPFTLDYV